MAKEIGEIARLISGDESAIEASTDSWHGKLIAKLLYQQPTTLRWQMREVLDSCLPPSARSSLDPFQAAMAAVISDDPYATLRALREGYGDGWLPAHLWDMLWRAGAVGVDVMDGEGSIDIRSYLMLQHAKALGACEPLWQLSALYASDLLQPPPALPAGALPHASRNARNARHAIAVPAATAADAAKRARAWLRELLRRQSAPLHAVKLRKLLALCETHGMADEAHALVAKATAAKRSARALVALPTTSMNADAVRSASPVAPLRAPIRPPAAAAAAAAGPLPALVATAHKALEEAVDAAAAPAGASKEEGRAMAELRVMLRCEGLGGATYYAGPQWLPVFFALLGVIAAPDQAGGAADGTGAQQAKSLLVTIASARGDVVGDGLPDALMLTLLQFFAGLTRHAPAHEPMLLGKSQGREKPTYSVADTQLLLRQLEGLKSSTLNTAPGEGPNSRANELAPEERALSLALSQALAAAVLDEVATPSLGTCWGAGV